MAHVTLKKIRTFAVRLVILTILFAPSFGQAATLTELQAQQKKAAEEAKKFRELEQQKHEEATTFQKQLEKTTKTITYVENAIEETVGEISEREGDISNTSKEINEKSERLTQLINEQNDVIVRVYKMGNPSSAELLAGSQTLSQYSDRLEFLRSIENRLNKVADEVTQTKHDLENKKSALEKQKNELVSLSGKQQAQKNGLEYERKQKDALLAQAKELEETFAQKAEAAEQKKQEFDRQVAAALRASATRGVAVKGKVSEGNTIGYMGNTGYSTGAHTHFSAIRNGTYVNPRGVSVSLPFNSYYVSQEFGRPNWAAKYAFHNGIDIISTSGYGAPVQAGCSGNTIEPFPEYNGFMPGGYGHYVVIDCGGGLWLLYGHLV